MKFSFTRFKTRFLIFSSNFFWPFVGLVAVCLAVFVVAQGVQLLRRVQVKPVDLLTFFGQGDQELSKTGDYTHFLLLGTRGDGSDSPNLADSIMIFSYHHPTSKISVTSIPRDLWVPSLQAKINSAYYYGEEASAGAGINFAQSAVLETIGVPIHYTAVVNFSLFKQLIDLSGGVDINLEVGFVDSMFPIPGKENALPESSRYETISFNSGLNHLDGETALKFVRSRHSSGEEGTDFARSRRQQQLLSALRQKILTTDFLLNKEKVDTLIKIISDNTKTNVQRSMYPVLVRIALESYKNPIRSILLSTNPDTNGITILYHPNSQKYKGEWVLMPKDDNWQALKQYIQNHLTSSM